MVISTSVDDERSVVPRVSGSARWEGVGRRRYGLPRADKFNARNYLYEPRSSRLAARKVGERFRPVFPDVINSHRFFYPFRLST